jgi:hypothetical protein
MLVAASAAFAQPAAIDLGTLGAGTARSETGAISGNQIIWYQFDLADEVSLAALRFADFTTVGTTIADSEIGVYNSTGALVATDDDDAIGNLSALSFGTGSDLPAGTGGVVSNGRDGTLLPGRYYVAVGVFNTTFNTTNWSVTSTGTASGNYTLNITINNYAIPPAPTATDLGTMSPNDVRNLAGETLAAGEIKWYRVAIPAISNAAATYFDGDTEGSALLPTNDTRFAVYNSIGRVVTADSDDGSGSLSQFSYGFTTPARPAVGNSLTYNGRDGALAAGTYYIAVGGGATAAVVFNPGFNATSTAANAGTFNLNLATGAVTSNPVVDGSFAPFSGVDNCGDSVTLLTATVTPGANPTSTTYVVTADLSALGGPSEVVLYNDGTNGDVSGTDNIFSLSYTIPSTATIGLSQPVFTVVDGQGRVDTDTGDITVSACPPPGTWREIAGVGGDAGQLPATAQVVQGAAANEPLPQIIGNFAAAADIDMYKISICDNVNFSATTFQGTTIDTQLFLFDSAGLGIAANDDVPNGFPGDATLQSRVSGTFVLTPGDYYLAVSRYNIDPTAAAALIFPNTPFDSELGATGPGGAGAVDGWSGTATSTGAYSVFFTGACRVFSGPSCAWQADGCFADYDNSGGIDGDDVIAFFGDWDGSLECADTDASGGVDGDDVINFFAAWDASGISFPGCE